MRVPRFAVRAVARVKPAIPPRAWAVLNTLASLVGDAPLVAEPAHAPTMTFFAHPDDETPCAGTLALAARSAVVRPIYATRGDATRGSTLSAAETARRRGEEAARSCATLGLAAPEFLGYGDGTLAWQVDSLAREVERLVGFHRPARLFVPWFLDGHADHRAVSAAVARAELPDSLEVWAFEWWTPLPPNRVVDVSCVAEAKTAAIACHATAAQAFDLSAMLGLSRWRSLSGLHGQGQAEAFIVLPHREYRSLCERFGGAS